MMEFLKILFEYAEVNFLIIVTMVNGVACYKCATLHVLQITIVFLRSRNIK